MKVLIAVLCLVGMVSPDKYTDSHRYQFSGIERYWTVCPKNTVLFTRNQSEPIQDIELKKEIDKKHELLISAEVTNKDTGRKVYSGKDLKICFYPQWDVQDTWDLFVVRFFKEEMMPRQALFDCPIEPIQYQIHRWTNTKLAYFPYKLSNGHYEISYTITSYDGEVVFKPLKFKFYSTELERLPAV